MRRVSGIRAVLLVTAGLVVGAAYMVRPTAAAPANDHDRLIVVEARLDGIAQQHGILLGLLGADLAGTLALLRRKVVDGGKAG